MYRRATLLVEYRLFYTLLLNAIEENCNLGGLYMYVGSTFHNIRHIDWLQNVPSYWHLLFYWKQCIRIALSVFNDEDCNSTYMYYGDLCMN